MHHEYGRLTLATDGLLFLFRQVGEHVPELRLVVVFAATHEAQEHLPAGAYQVVSGRQSGAGYQADLGAVSGTRAVPTGPVPSHDEAFV